MPIYNNEDTLRPVIEAILNQTISGFELILINDGSTDASAQICREYAEKEPLLIEVSHQEKAGFAKARNRGLTQAKGSYVYFADAQTILTRRMLEENLKLAEEQQAELVVFGLQQQAENTHEVREYIPKLPFLLTKERFRNHFRNFHYYFPYELCNKFFERHYLNTHRIKFDDHSIYAKAFFNLAVYQHLTRVVFIRKVFCQKLFFPKHIVHSDPTECLEKNLELLSQLKNMLTDWGLATEYDDLITKAYFDLLESAILNLMTPYSNVTSQELEVAVNQLLTEERISPILNKENSFEPKDFYEKVLWNYFRNRNTRGIIKIIRRKNQTDKITNNIKGRLRNWLS